MTDVVFIYLFFPTTLSQKNVKRIQYFDKKNKIANRVYLYNLLFFFLSATRFLIVL